MISAAERVSRCPSWSDTVHCGKPSHISNQISCTWADQSQKAISLNQFTVLKMLRQLFARGKRTDWWFPSLSEGLDWRFKSYWCKASESLYQNVYWLKEDFRNWDLKNKWVFNTLIHIYGCWLDRILVRVWGWVVCCYVPGSKTSDQMIWFTHLRYRGVFWNKL